MPFPRPRQLRLVRASEKCRQRVGVDRLNAIADGDTFEVAKLKGECFRAQSNAPHSKAFSPV